MNPTPELLEWERPKGPADVQADQAGADASRRRLLGGATRHGLSCLVRARRKGDVFLLRLEGTALWRTKLFITSPAEDAGERTSLVWRTPLDCKRNRSGAQRGPWSAPTNVRAQEFAVSPSGTSRQ